MYLPLNYKEDFEILKEFHTYDGFLKRKHILPLELAKENDCPYLNGKRLFSYISYQSS